MVFRALAIITLVSNVGALRLIEDQTKIETNDQSVTENEGGIYPLNPLEIAGYMAIKDKQPPISDKHPEIRPGTGVPLKSGDKFVLESEVEPGLYITTRKKGQTGKAMKMDLAHIKGGQLHLKSGISDASTFSFENKDSSGIKSGDMVKWIQGDKRIDLDMMTNWPNTPVMNKRPKAAPDFLVEHGRDVPREMLEVKFGSPEMFAQQKKFSEALEKDTRKGEAIKDGDSIWIRRHAGPIDSHGEWLFMTGDLAEGGHVAFPHHYPLFDGHIKNYAKKSWFNTNDPHSTSSRFTVRKVSIHPEIQLLSEKPKDGLGLTQIIVKRDWSETRQ